MDFSLEPGFLLTLALTLMAWGIERGITKTKIAHLEKGIEEAKQQASEQLNGARKALDKRLEEHTQKIHDNDKRLSEQEGGSREVAQKLDHLSRSLDHLSTTLEKMDERQHLLFKQVGDAFTELSKEFALMRERERLRNGGKV